MHPKSRHASTLDLSGILRQDYAGSAEQTFNPAKKFDFELEKTLDEKVLLKELGKALEKKQKKSIHVKVCQCKPYLWYNFWFGDHQTLSGRTAGGSFCDPL